MFKTIRKTGWADLIAGVSVAIVAIPQSLAYAQLAGLPAYIGLYAGILPTIVAGMFGASPYIATGATAIVSLIVFSSLSSLAAEGSSSYLVFAAVLALMVGVIQIILALVRAGTLIKYIGRPVITGFITAAALIILRTQLPALTGSAITTLFGLWSFVMLIVIPLVYPRVPAVLIVSLLATAVSWIFGYTGERVGMIPLGIPVIAGYFTYSIPWLSLILPAGIIAVIGYVEGFLTAGQVGHHKKRKPNTELGALGLANIAAAISGAFPVAGSISRTALQEKYGAQTGLASVVVGVTTAGVMLFAAPVLFYLPVATLSAIIIAAIIKLIQPAGIIYELRRSRRDALVMLATFVTTLVFAPHLEYGIAVGVGLSFALRMLEKLGSSRK